MTTLNVTRTQQTLKPDSARVLFRPFRPTNGQRAVRIIARIMTLDEATVHAQVETVLQEFSGRHQKARDFFLEQFELQQSLLLTDLPLTEDRRLLIGAYFTNEYSLESAALFNPCVIPHPDQSDVEPGSLKMIVSLRATGEGHISSITFRSAIVDAEGRVTLRTPNRFVTAPRQIRNKIYDKELFSRKLNELGITGELRPQILQALGDSFAYDELSDQVKRIIRQSAIHHPETNRELQAILHLARSNYEVQFSPEQTLSERIIFPSGPSESNGIEDARFVLFHPEEGPAIYCATYTAYDGRVALPQILETTDFLHFKMSTLNGPAVENKGMALFPRKINGQYAMLSRQDNENIFLMFSDNLHFWHTAQIILKPTFPWEYVQLGNCGSPLETEAGWLVISHGVGAMRKYSIGAFLLDRDNPSKVIGRLREPLLTPNEIEREGYVPNVVYSCGSLIHNGLLILPYAMSDYASSFATVPVKDVIDAME